MKKIDNALHEMCSLDREASRDGVLNRLSPVSKLLFTLLYTILVMQIKNEYVTYLILMSVYPVVVFILTDVSFIKCIKRMKLILAFVIIMGGANVIFARELMLGILSMTGLIIKGILTVFAVYILIAVTRIEDICRALRKLHVPEVIVTTVLLIYRYINVLLKEFKKMSESYQMMTSVSGGVSIKYAGAFAGNLLLRSINKAKTVYDSMNLRGYEWSVKKEDNQ